MPRITRAIDALCPHGAVAPKNRPPRGGVGVVVIHERGAINKRLAVAAAGIAAALALTGAALSQGRSAKLVGTVGPGFTIKLTQGGAKVKTLKAGKYTFVITDKASIHNFTLEQEKGGKFEKHLTGTSFTGTKTATVTLKKGKWKYYCSNHEAEMFGFFTVK